MNTLESVFRLVDQVTQPLKGIMRTGGETTKSLKSVGGAVDDINKHVSSVTETNKAVKGLGDTGTRTGEQLKKGMDKSSRAFKEFGAASSTTLDKLNRKLLETEALIEKKKKFDLDTSAAEAKIRILKHEIRSIETTKARAELSNLGLVTRQLAGDMGGGGGTRGPPGIGGAGAGGGGLIGAFKALTKGIPLMAAAAVAAAPAIVALGGALGALAGSLGQGVLGAGALGVGAFGAAAAGILSIVSVAKPAINEIKKIKTAQDAYNKSVSQYGAASSQAAKAHAELLRQQKQGPAGAGQLLQNAHTFNQQWQQATRPAQASLIGIGNDTIQSGAAVMPQFSAMVNANMSAVRSAVHDFVSVLTGPEFMRIWAVVSHTFQQSVGPFSRGLGNIALYFGHIARAASPMVISMFQHFERSSFAWQETNKGVGETQTKIQGLVDQTKRWWELTKSLGRLITTLGSSGAAAGGSLVERMTTKLNQWTDWIDKNPGKMQAFWDRSINGAKSLTSALGKLVGELAKIADQLLPLLTMLSDITGFGAQNGLLGPAAAVLGARRLGKVFGRGGAGGAAAGGLGAAEAGALGYGTAAGARAMRAGGLAGIRETYGIQRALGAGRGGALLSGLGRGAGLGAEATAGGLLKFGARAAGRVALPITALMAGYDFLSTPGNLGQRGQAVASGLTFGAIHAPELGTQSRQRGIDRAAKYTADHPQIGHQMAHLRELESQYAATKTQTAEGAGKGGSTLVRVTPVVQGAARRRLKAEIEALKPIVSVGIRAAQTTHGAKLADDIIGAFSIRLKKGSEYALKKFQTDLHSSFQQTGSIGKRVIAQSTVDWANQLAHGTKKQKAIAQQLRKDIVKEYKTLGINIAVVNDNIVTGTDKDWSRISGLMISSSEQALEEVSKNFTDLQKQAIAALQLMGYNKSDAQKLIRNSEKGGTAGVAANNTLKNPKGGPSVNVQRGLGANPAGAKNMKASGGRIGGYGSQDNQAFGHNLLAPGELVVNAAQENQADMKLGGQGALSRLVGATKTLHSVTKTQQRMAQMQTRAKGGSVGSAIGAGLGSVGGAVGTRSGGYGGVTGGLANLIHQLDSMGFRHGSTTGGGHASNSYHYKGMAVDYGDASNDMQRLWSVVFPMRQQFAELFGPTRTTPGPHLMHNGVGFTDGSLQSQHQNHIHIALTGGGARLQAGGGALAGGAQQISLKPRQTRSKGVPGVLAQKAMNAQTKGLEDKINKQLAVASGGGNLSGFTGGGSSGANQALGHKMMLAFGYPESEWPALRALWQGESNWSNVMNTGGSGATGIPQALPGSKMASAGADWRTNPATQIKWGLGYIRSTYGTPSHALSAWQSRSPHWYGSGGRLPGMDNHDWTWAGGFKGGGSFTAHKPTILGVGEGNTAETVTVHKHGGERPSASAAPIVHVKIDTINNHREGDIAKHVEQEFNKVTRRLYLVDGSGDDEMS